MIYSFVILMPFRFLIRTNPALKIWGLSINIAYKISKFLDFYLYSHRAVVAP